MSGLRIIYFVIVVIKFREDSLLVLLLSSIFLFVVGKWCGLEEIGEGDGNIEIGRGYVKVS